ncbi:MAG: phosphatase PAP2 family protein [Gammaproteobacteria bacterium]|nr:phosphatase PAP2 family protein [Gammaproteobacteria bacterium]
MNAFFSLLLLLTLSGCASQQTHWGSNAYHNLSPQRLLHSANKSLHQTQTWLPALGSLVFNLSDLDQQTSDWASRQNPIFGSQSNARRYSDDLRSVLLAETIATALLTPSGNTPSQWLANKSRGISAQLLAGGLAGSSSEHLKDLFQRRRPDGSDKRSYPSGHATTAASYATLTNANLAAFALNPKQRQTISDLNWGLAGGVAWARVEGQKHYPSDVLAGMALGHFVSATLNDFLLGQQDSEHFELHFSASEGNGQLHLRWRFR